METLFSDGEEIETERQRDGETERDENRPSVSLSLCLSVSPSLCPPSAAFYFALVGYSRSNTNSVMNSARATTEVFAAQ